MTSTRLQTALRYIGAFEQLSVETFLNVMTSGCQQFFAPASLSLPSPLDRDAFTSHISHLKEILDGFPVFPNEIIEVVDKNQVVVWASSEVKFHEELMDTEISKEEWRYKGEYMFILNMDESEEKIERVVEFLDSKGTEVLRGLMQRARLNKANLGK